LLPNSYFLIPSPKTTPKPSPLKSEQPHLNQIKTNPIIIKSHLNSPKTINSRTLQAKISIYHSKTPNPVTNSSPHRKPSLNNKTSLSKNHYLLRSGPLAGLCGNQTHSLCNKLSLIPCSSNSLFSRPLLQKLTLADFQNLKIKKKII
jgi:hypothetical protein